MTRPLRVLILEDSENDAELLLRELRRQNYEPDYHRVDSAAALNEALDREPWSLIISDYAMPQFTAMHALDILKRRNLDLPFVIVSGTIGEETAVVAMKSGAHDFLMKGKLTRLGAAIERELRDAQERKEHKKAEEALRRTKADPGQIEQVIMNLVVNARDAMPQGGKLTLETANVDLDDAYAARHVGVRAGAYILLAVSDTGCGMDREAMAHIFEPFFTTKGPGKGTGLGLSTVYGIVKQSGGNVWAYSEPGLGTTFKIYLPQVDGTVERVPRDARRAGVPRGSETILLVEDQKELRELVLQMLEMNGYAVLAAGDGF